MQLLNSVKEKGTQLARKGCQVAKAAFEKAGNVVVKTGAAAAVGLATTAALAGSARADTNEGVGAIVTALNGLKPDLGTVVTAAIGIALISMGAVVAVSIGKRLMGK